MRLICSRGNFQPQTRIDGLRRYAFIGDSITFGVGVAPDQTLPGCAERQMNSACTDSPVETVNFGVSGYNLWNSWIDFKSVPQVYDGVVLTLCTNDSEFFCRTYKVPNPEPRWQSWLGENFCGEGVVRCFEDMAAFAKETGLPVAICFSYLWDHLGTQRVRDILAELCVSHEFVFIDGWAAIKERNFPREAMVISECDFHPSALVHEAVGRYLVRTLEQAGWFVSREVAAMDMIAERVMASARVMIEADEYPTDAACGWGARVLDIKLHRERRRQALSGEPENLASLTKAHADLAAANHFWHANQRIKAFLDELSRVHQALAMRLIVSEEERLRLDELAFALQTRNWSGLSGKLKEIPAGFRDMGEKRSPLSSEVTDGYLADLESARELLAAMRRQPEPTKPPCLPDDDARKFDLDAIARLVERVRLECLRLQESSTRFTGALDKALPNLSQGDTELVSYLGHAAMGKAQKSLAFVHGWPNKVKGIIEPSYAGFTTIEISVRSPKSEDKHPCFVRVRGEYHVPNRLPSEDNGSFLADGTAKFVKLHLPLFYAGRLFINTNARFGVRIDFELIKVEVYNLDHHRRQIPADQFFIQPSGWRVSPMTYLY